MKQIKSFLTIAAFLCVSISWGQDMKVSGTVYDTTGTKPIMNAMAMAIRMKDSLLLGFVRTDANGYFDMKGIPVDTFSLIIESPGYDEKIYYIFGHADNQVIEIPAIVMPTKSQDLDEVVIYAYKDPIYYKGDTLIYTADSFATHEGAVVEDLLKKLPGITVDKDGKITSQGREISQVLVDGDEFFGSDPTIATKNLGADGIDQVQIYEKENDEGIGGDDEKIQVLDLKLKESAKKGYFGRISGASDFALTPINGELGTNPFYEGELLLNKFNGKQKISIFALGSNTPRSQFGWGDMKKFGLENETTSGSRWNMGGSSVPSGVPQTLMAGIYFTDKIGKKKKSKIGVNYSYYNNYLDANSASRSQYFLDTSYVTDDSIRAITKGQSHRVNLNLELQLDSLTTLQIKPTISFDTETVENTNISDFFELTGTQMLGTRVDNDTESKGYSIGGYARLNRKFMKKKRELEVRYDISLDDNETDGLIDSRTAYYSAGLFNDTTRQSNVNDNSNTNHYATITYLEPIGKKFQLEFEYLYQYGFSTQDKSTFDFNTATNDYSILNAGLTNIFDNTRQQNRAGIRLLYESKKHSFNIGGRFRNINIENITRLTDTTSLQIDQNINNFLPRLGYSFKPSMSKRININYQTSSQQPSTNDLAPVLNNANPNRIQEGNPDLKPNYVHSVNIGFNNWSALSGRYVYAGSYASLTDNAFSSSTSYDSFGRTISKTVNVDGNMMATVYSGAGLPFFGRKFTLRPELNGTYFRSTSYISDDENITNTYALTPGLDIDLLFLKDSLEIGFESSYSYNNAVSTLYPDGTPYSITTVGADFEWTLPLGFTVGAEGTFTKNAQPGEGFYDTEFFVLNAEVSKKFLKTQNLMISLVGNDILNQNVNARREVNGNIITDYRTTIISRYFLLKATLRFNNRKAKEDDFNGMH
ncbi:MAG: outer membrane receptor protein involved in Fe transport [Crocinitomicaceae bacterium]|jgi:outer membrane receptor protein involved in Fe transport